MNLDDNTADHRNRPARAVNLLSYRSSGSILSIGSTDSILSVGSVGSILSVASLGSVLSVLSVGSFGSVLGVGAFGSILSLGAVGAVLTTGSYPVAAVVVVLALVAPLLIRRITRALAEPAGAQVARAPEPATSIAAPDAGPARRRDA